MMYEQHVQDVRTVRLVRLYLAAVSAQIQQSKVWARRQSSLSGLLSWTWFRVELSLGQISSCDCSNVRALLPLQGSRFCFIIAMLLALLACCMQVTAQVGKNDLIHSGNMGCAEWRQHRILLINMISRFWSENSAMVLQKYESQRLFYKLQLLKQRCRQHAIVSACFYISVPHSSTAHAARPKTQEKLMMQDQLHLLCYLSHHWWKAMKVLSPTTG